MPRAERKPAAPFVPVRKYATGQTPRQGDIVAPTGDTTGLQLRHYLVRGVSRYRRDHSIVSVLAIVEQHAERHRREAEHVRPDRFKLIKRGEQQ